MSAACGIGYVSGRREASPFCTLFALDTTTLLKGYLCLQPSNIFYLGQSSVPLDHLPTAAFENSVRVWAWKS